MIWHGHVPTEGGVQWLEARGFERLYVNNPEAQARAAKFLLGLLKRCSEEAGVNGAEDEQIRDALMIVIRGFTSRYPQFLETEYQLDSELGSGTYSVDPLLFREISEIIYDTNDNL